jgi:Na+/H+-dicarboxylate symporter
MKTASKWAIIIAVIAGLELAFGINDTGGKVALALLVWSCLSIPIGLAIGALCRFGEYGYDDEPYTRT